MDVFWKYGTDFYILVRDFRPTYFIDLNFYGKGLGRCDCPDYEFRKERYVGEGMIDDCKHLIHLKREIKNLKEKV